MSKKRMDHTILDVIRLQPTWLLNKQTHTDKLESILSYLHRLADAGYSDILKYYFGEVFDGFDVTQLTMAEINQKLRNHTPVPKTVETQKARVLPISFVSSSTLRKEMLRNYDWIDSAISDRNSQHDDVVTSLGNYTSQLCILRQKIAEKEWECNGLDLAIAQLYELKQTKSGRTEYNTKIKKVMEQAISVGWIPVDVSQNIITFFNREPIYLTESNAASGVARTLKMGHYGILLKVNDDSCRYVESIRFADNIKAPRRSTLHPHMLQGSICFGNRSHIAEAALECSDIAKYFTVVTEVLSNYNAASPYLSMDVFNRSKSTGYQALNLDRLKGLFPDNDDSCRIEKRQRLKAILLETADERLAEAINNTSWFTTDNATRVGRRIVSVMETNSKKQAAIIEKVRAKLANLDGDTLKAYSIAQFREKWRDDVGIPIPKLHGDRLTNDSFSALSILVNGKYVNKFNRDRITKFPENEFGTICVTRNRYGGLIITIEHESFGCCDGYDQDAWIKILKEEQTPTTTDLPF